MQTVIIVNLWHIFALRYQTSNGSDRALNWMLLVEFTAWAHSNAQEIAVHVAIIDFLQVWTTGKKIARPDDVTVKIRNQQHEQVPGVSKCANATRHLKNIANKLLNRSTCAWPIRVLAVQSDKKQSFNSHSPNVLVLWHGIFHEFWARSQRRLYHPSPMLRAFSGTSASTSSKWMRLGTATIWMDWEATGARDHDFDDFWWCVEARSISFNF